HESLKKIFTPTWRIVGASMLAYLISQNFDVFFYGMIKRLAPRHLWLRNNGSTWCSQAIDTIVFCTAAFIGMYESQVILGIIASTYILKIVVAAIDTPFIYLSRLIVKLRPSILPK
ncbi:MAG: VUT family protein, partial [Spirochaetes bacterium]